MGFHETRYLLVEPADDTRYGHPYHGIDRSNSAQVVTAMSASPAKEVLEEEARFWDDNDDWDFSLPTLEVATSFHERYRRCGVAFEILGVSVCQSEAEVKLAEQVEGYLGLDVSSLEPHSAIHPASIWKDFSDCVEPKQLLPIWRLEQAYFRPRLNRWGLLSSYVDAALMRDLSEAFCLLDPRQGDPVGVQIIAIAQIPLIDRGPTQGHHG